MARRFSLSSLLPQSSEGPSVCRESTVFYLHATLPRMEVQLAHDEPEVDGVPDQLGSALHTQCPHHFVFVGFDGACGQL